MSDEYSRVKARVVTKDGLTETIIRKVDFENGKPVKSFLTRSGGWVRTGAGERILPECYLPSEVYSPEPEKPVMSKINSRQLFGIPFVLDHPEIFPEEASRGWYVDWNESSPADTVDYFEVTKPNKVTVTLEVKVGIRRVQQ